MNPHLNNKGERHLSATGGGGSPGGHHGGGGWRPRGYGWGGWGWPGYYAPIYDAVPINIDIDTSATGASRCRLNSAVTFVNKNGKTQTIPAGTIVQSIPYSQVSMKIFFAGQWIAVRRGICDPVSGFSSADGTSTDFAAAYDRSMVEKKALAGFVLAGMVVGLYLAKKHPTHSILDYALMAMFGAGGGFLVGEVAKGSVATLLTKNQAAMAAPASTSAQPPK